MLPEKLWLKRVGWIAYALTWVALLANIANDWLTRQWISPLSIIVLALLTGGTLVQVAQGEPIIQTEGATGRLLGTLMLILLVLVAILGYALLWPLV